jgi:hypothetical protein
MRKNVLREQGRLASSSVLGIGPSARSLATCSARSLRMPYEPASLISTLVFISEIIAPVSGPGL